MSTLTDFRTWVAARIRDGASFLDQTSIDNQIQHAVSHHSRYVPQIARDLVDGDGTYTYDLPSDWDSDFSVIISIEYPQGEQIPVYLEGNDYLIYNDGTDYLLRFIYTSPSATEDYLLTYTIPHTVTALASTISAKDEQAVADLAACFCLRELASRQAQTNDATIFADSVDTQTSSQQYNILADRYMKQYREYVGIGIGGEYLGAGGSIAQTQFLDLDTSMQDGSGRFFHSRRRF